MTKLNRFLGNLNTLDVHDTSNEHPSCQLDEIDAAHRKWYDALVVAKSDHANDNCAWRIGNSNR